MKKTTSKTIIFSAALASIVFSGCSTISGNSVSSNLDMGSSLSARALECCLSTEDAVQRKMHDHIQKNTTFTIPDKNNDFGMTWEIKGDGKGLNKGVHTLVLNYVNADKTNPDFGSSKVSVELPFVVLNPEIGQHTLSFIVDGKPDYSVTREKGASLLAPIDVILQDAKRIQGSNDFANGPVSASIDYAGAQHLTIGHVSVVEIDDKEGQHIVAYDTAGNRIIVDQVIENDSYRFVKNNTKCVLVKKNGKDIILPIEAGLNIQPEVK